MEILFATPQARVLYYAPQALLEVEFSGFVSGEAFRQPYDEALRLVSVHGSRRWLTNYTQMRVVRQADQQWLLTDWAPRYNRLPTLRGTAIVVATDPMNRFYTDLVLPEAAVGRPWPTRQFEERAAAWDWLLTR